MCFTGDISVFANHKSLKVVNLTDCYKISGIFREPAVVYQLFKARCLIFIFRRYLLFRQLQGVEESDLEKHESAR